MQNFDPNNSSEKTTRQKQTQTRDQDIIRMNLKDKVCESDVWTQATAHKL
jgi:hypothetical protein